MNRIVFLNYLAAIAALALSGCGEDDVSESDKTTPLIVGMEMAYPPFEMRGPDDKPDGISVRMAEDLAAHLGRPLEIVDVEWNGIIPAVKTGKIDLIISSMTRTPERERQIDFSDDYVTNGLCMLVGKDTSILSIADIKAGKNKVSVKSATTGHQWAASNLPGVELVVLDDAAICALEVAQGKVAAFIYDQVSIYRHWKQHEYTTRPILNPIRNEAWAIGLRKGNDVLRLQVNEFLEIYRKEGKFNELADRYMAEEKSAFEGLGVPFIFH